VDIGENRLVSPDEPSDDGRLPRRQRADGDLEWNASTERYQPRQRIAGRTPVERIGDAKLR
jgi:hypothetical protein